MQALATNSQKPQRIKMIRDALEEKAPKMFRELQQERKLDQFLNDQEEQMMEAYGAGYEKILADHQREDSLEMLQNINREELQLWHETLETFLEFPDQTTE
jgi:hypothetical protein